LKRLYNKIQSIFRGILQIKDNKARQYVLSTMNSLPYPMSMGEIKEAVLRVSTLPQCPSLVEHTVHDLLGEGKIISVDSRYLSRRHVPRFRAIDADWQW
jgi:hypothetical protein